VLRPAPSFVSLLGEEVDRISEAPIPRGPGCLEVIQRTKEIIAPRGLRRSPGEMSADDTACPMGSIELVPQKERAAAGKGSRDGELVLGSESTVLPQPLQDQQRGVERGMAGASGYWQFQPWSSICWPRRCSAIRSTRSSSVWRYENKASAIPVIQVSPRPLTGRRGCPLVRLRRTPSPEKSTPWSGRKPSSRSTRHALRACELPGGNPRKRSVQSVQ